MVDNEHLGQSKKRIYKILPALLIIAVFGLSSCHKTDTLFNSKNSSWTIRGDAQWNFTNEMLEGICNNNEGFLMTKSPYGDFELLLEFFPDSTINSGVFVRCQDFELSATDCHEMNIWDLHPNQEFRTGAIVTKSKPLAKVRTLNRWNTYRIQCLGQHIQVWINDTLTAKLEDVTLKKGYIGLQASGKGRIKFRNLDLKPI